MHYPRERCGGAKECVCPGCDARPVRFTSGEESGGGKGFLQSLHADADHAAERGADGHAGDEDAGGDFAAVGDYYEEGAEGCGEGEGEDHVPAVFASVRIKTLSALYSSHSFYPFPPSYLSYHP